ncbi:GNAT family N-acetyltransferase [bacterium]|nr:GNAT family N-acetyltransferase [bacterium]MBU4560745.1 GNAT family N-acetyltransferase [bacterium]MCG2677611.1 GNAT family N-acetyltransferase [bacterium]
MSYYPISGLFIRKYRKADRGAIRKICCDTAFMGGPMEKFFDDREILADCLTSYYTDYEPESIFVAELNKEVAGYLIGCKSLKREKKVFITKILPRILLKSFLKGVLFKSKTRSFCVNCFKSFLRGEFNRRGFLHDYPASLHINVDYRFRNMGIGKELIKKYLDYLKIEGVKGVQLTTISSKAREFFKTTGFTVLYCQKISYYRNLTGKDLFRIILGRKLN